ncbi:hypothetical protein Xen7305DRAFT_00048420 [Xenococcus sp. PCC 7305]|uniref:DUF4336 domain-containing protein n=1 Tax=Xenococcus sp. PCC 7305 TaxID=102125 RepID=UPI0002ACE17E|nr:DUF4336 domain-containing protein [Xenococcus sp. PCC 7305]ELS05103.1 hypothetical protein Xen7305DRAFT_00048420 [Xenococcus sp. PCC 7305]
MDKVASRKDVSWPFWPIVPIYPYGQRKTIRREIVKDAVWTFEQIQGIFYVVVPIRMSVIKLEQGGLLVYAPVAPTIECLRLVQELVEEHGEIKYIILPTISGIEHKVFVGPFAQKFPTAEVFVAPQQWSFPLNLPLSWLGLPGKRTQVLPQDSNQTPFADQLEIAILDTIDLRLGQFSEVALFDKRSRTLLVTDSLVSIPQSPPAIVELDSYPLLFHARENALEPIVDSPENRLKGWQRICLFAMYFQPTVLAVPQWSQVFRNAFSAPDKSSKAYFGLYPFQWQNDWQNCFHALCRDGRLLVAPILQSLIMNRDRKGTLNWIDHLATWDFQQIIPCHFDAPIIANSRQLRQSFAFLESAWNFGNHDCLPAEDFKTIQQIDYYLSRLKIIPRSQVGN